MWSGFQLYDSPKSQHIPRLTARGSIRDQFLLKSLGRWRAVDSHLVDRVGELETQRDFASALDVKVVLTDDGITVDTIPSANRESVDARVETYTSSTFSGRISASALILAVHSLH